MSRLALLLAVAMAAAMGFDGVAALPTCEPIEVRHLNSDKIVLAVIGDWGRVGASESFFSPTTVNLCATSRQCCATEQDNTFPGDFDLSDATDGPQQVAAAGLMNEICGKMGCQGVLSTGDNFYPCGADKLVSGLNRFESDWAAVYNKQHHLKNLPWYITTGNHDYGFVGSVDLQQAYGLVNAKWVFPSDYFAVKFYGKDFSAQLHSLDATPMVQSYAYPSPNYAYFHSDFQAKAVPSFINSEASMDATTGMCSPLSNDSAPFITGFSDNATGQIPWLKSCLQNNTADWNFVMSHYALWGSDQEYANRDTPKYYPGLCGGWASVAELVKEYKVDAYFNGHDHTMTHADPQHAGTSTGSTLGIGNLSYSLPAKGFTQYFTFGNGGSLSYGDGVTPESPKDINNFSSVIYNNNYHDTPGEGFGIVTITKCSIQVDMYSYMFYEKHQKPVHSVHIPGNC